jgi:hypothetical protein
MEIVKQIAVGAGVWAVTSIVVWLVAKMAIVRSYLQNNMLRTVLFALLLGGVVSSLISGFYATHLRDQLVQNLLVVGENKGLTEANQAPTNGGHGPVLTTCPDGFYAVGLKSWGNSAGGICIGCLVNTQLLCRQLNAK